MNTREAVSLIREAVAGSAGTWVDLGAGSGVFTRALVSLLGDDGRVYAVDREPSALADLRTWAARQAPNVIPVLADFTAPFELPGLGRGRLDGLLFANALHFVPEPAATVARFVARLRTAGRVVFVEYDQRRASRWVPYPIPAAKLPELAAASGLSAPIVTATRPSTFGGQLYVARADKIARGRDGVRPRTARRTSRSFSLPVRGDGA